MESGPNILDIALLVLLGFFIIRGAVRGFVREIMGLIGLVAALFLGVATYKPLAGFLRRVSAIEAGWWDGVAFALVLLVVFLAFVYMAAALARLIHAGPFSGLDRLFGSGVGGAKGILLSYLLLNILLMVLPLAMLAQPEGQQGSLVSRSLVAPRVIQCGRYLLDLLPQDWTREMQAKAGLIKPKTPEPGK
ncbi:MAG: CvpA family protein [Desulfarculus sp.]|nr:CvpA family protein [Desulfarculus sp.]